MPVRTARGSGADAASLLIVFLLVVLLQPRGVIGDAIQVLGAGRLLVIVLLIKAGLGDVFALLEMSYPTLEQPAPGC